MNIKNRIQNLYQKLQDESISREEYEEFLAYTEDESLRLILDEILHEDLKTRFQTKDQVRLGPFRKGLVRRISVIGAIAASLTILVVAALRIWNLTGETEIFYSTAYGETKKVILPDSSLVNLNANTNLTWIEVPGESVRVVKLSGEAFFDVRSMPEKPFRVYSNEMVIEVLGTAFNVNNRENKEEVFLEEGSIRISGKQNALDTLLLKTGEAAFFNTQSEKMVKTSDSRFEDQAKWKDGILKFSNVPAQDVLRELQHIYGVRLILEDQELQEKPMDFALPYSNWEVVSKAFALALGTELIEYDNHYEFIRK